MSEKTTIKDLIKTITELKQDQTLQIELRRVYTLSYKDKIALEALGYIEEKYGDDLTLGDVFDILADAIAWLVILSGIHPDYIDDKEGDEWSGDTKDV